MNIHVGKYRGGFSRGHHSFDISNISENIGTRINTDTVDISLIAHSSDQAMPTFHDMKEWVWSLHSDTCNQSTISSMYLLPVFPAAAFIMVRIA